MTYTTGSTADLRRRWKRVLAALQSASAEFGGTDSLLGILDAEMADYRLLVANQASGLIRLAIELAAVEARTIEGIEE